MLAFSTVCAATLRRVMCQLYISLSFISCHLNMVLSASLFIFVKDLAENTQPLITQ